MTVATSDPFPLFECADDSEQSRLELADLFLAESRQWLNDISAAIADHDVDALVLSAQSLKCSLAAFQFDEAYEIAARFERLARHVEWERLRPAARELAAMCALARKAVRRWRAKSTEPLPVG